jgi:hypothetical protein
MTGLRPMLRIPAELEKGNQNRLLAMAPEFGEFLERTPPEDRKGRVFKLKSPSGRPGWAMRSDTTMQFYVGRNAERTADALWAAVEEKPLRAKLRTTDQSGDTVGESRNEKTPDISMVLKYTRQESNL